MQANSNSGKPVIVGLTEIIFGNMMFAQSFVSNNSNEPALWSRNFEILHNALRTFCGRYDCRWNQ
jgi:hypothetical protein